MNKIFILILIFNFAFPQNIIYDNYSKNSREHKLMVYNTKHDFLKTVLNDFYWPFYLKLLCIHQLLDAGFGPHHIIV